MKPYEFRCGFFFAGLGAGALGFIRALGKLGKDEARFVNVGGIDNDPAACADFEYLTGGEALCADMHEMQPAAIRKLMGDTAPDAIFFSPPCKGLSGLLGKKAAEAPKYKKLNDLVWKGIFLACETWPTPPALLVLENVPRIQSRGKDLLTKAKTILRHYGYEIHEGNHDCGEIGGLAQHRRRYLLVARLPAKVPSYVYRPPLRPVKACGTVLELLPMPQDPSAGELHKLPKLSWLNWVRLALIPAGGDWRDLPTSTPKDPQARKDWEQKGKKTPGEKHLFKGKHGVMDWAVIGGPSNGASNVADPRLGDALGLKQTANGADGFKGRPGLFGVLDWHEPAHAITASQGVSGSCGRSAVADPRAVGVNARSNRFSNQYKVYDWKGPVGAVTGDTDIQEGAKSVADPRGFNAGGKLGVLGWEQPAATVTGESYPTNGRNAVADPRVGFNGEPFGHVCKVTPWDQPAGTVTSSQSPSSGAAAVADPRLPAELTNPLAPGQAKRTEWARWDVRGWDQPARTVAGSGSNGGFGVADPRIDLDHEPRPGSYEVTAWTDPAKTVRGTVQVQNGGGAVADPRVELDPTKRWERSGALMVQPWDEPAATIRGRADVRTGPAAVADPRIDLPSCQPDRHHNKYRVSDWAKPMGTVIGATRPGSGAACVADPRSVTLDDVAINCAPRAGYYTVLGWDQAARTVTGTHDPCGLPAIADPRKPPGFIPVIISKDGTWHRPLTTLELAALQGIPTTVEGAPLKLHGKKISGWRERIGNAVPVGAGAAIAESLLTALLAAKLGTWVLGGEGIWVRKRDGRTEVEALKECTEGAVQ
jgi:site-specific DNA-cytosine methylase